MKAYQGDKICNIALAGHGSEGKTTLVEAMLFTAGSIDRAGRIEDGTTAMDYDPEEAKRGISISAALAPIEWKDHKINVIDTPGFFDFHGELLGPMQVSDCTLIVLGAVSGITVGAEKVWNLAVKAGASRGFIVNQMDRENANFTKVVDQLTEMYGASVVPVMLPIMKGASFAGYVDVISGKAYEFSGKTEKEIATPDDLQDARQTALEQLMEAIAGADDALMEKYFDVGELTDEEIAQGLPKGIAQGLVIPVLATSSLQGGLGVAHLMDFIATRMPTPLAKPEAVGVNPKTDKEETRSCDIAAPFSARVFKTLADPFVGRLSLIKVMSGSLGTDTPLYNANVEKNEKAGSVNAMMGKKLVTADRLNAGDIGALAKLQFTQTGHTLCDAAHPILYPAIPFPRLCISMAVYAKKQGDEDKIFSGLHRLEEEDPSFKVEKSSMTTETLISGQGELHLEVISKKLSGKFGAEMQLQDPRVPYRETIRKSVKAEGRHKKQSGGHGQYGHCWIEFEPIFDGPEFEFVDKVVGGVVPRQFIPAVEKGLRENLPKGVIAGYPLVNIRATLYDGSFHAVDSSEMAFKTAARLALKKGCVDANPALLEPIETVKVYVPDDFMGDIIGDMNRRRGRIMGMNPAPDGGQCVEAEVPLTEMFKYATDLRSMTQGRGSFEMEFARYDEVPGNIAQKIIENAKLEADEDE